MYILCKSTGEYSDTSWEVLGYSNDKNVLETIKTKLDNEQQELDILVTEYYNEHFDSKYPRKRYDLTCSQYSEELIEYNKKLIADNPKYLPYVVNEYYIIIDNRNAFYYIQEVKELLS
jgi:hypothetical protein